MSLRVPCPPRALAALSAALLLAACKGGRGDTCRCASDCGGGLECYAEGQASLDAGQCFKPPVAGTCVESLSLDSDSSPVELTEPPTYYDLGSRRDLSLPTSGVSDSMTSTLDTTGTSTLDTTGTSTGDTTGTSTGDTTGTSTGDTTGTGTSTGDTTGTGTSTGDTTGTSTGDTSTGTSDGSSSGGSSGSSTG